MKKIAVFGSTGSIGTQTLDVVAQHPDVFKVELISANRNIDLLKKQILQFQPKWVIVRDFQALNAIRDFCKNLSTCVYGDWTNLPEILNSEPFDYGVLAISGAAGIEPALMVIDAGINLSLANKETLVAGGELVYRHLAESESELLPVDSEHSAIFQCMQGQVAPRSLILTASGGPFRTFSKAQLEKVSLKEALAHPTWSMGKKITVDSATLMNKGLEVIEAHWLFDMPYDQIDVVVHPESVIHSMIEFVDGSRIAQLGPSDMRLPIQYALTYPERIPLEHKKFKLTDIGALHFEEPDLERFPALGLAYEAGKMGGSMPAVLNAANEVAVGWFLEEKISFLAITQVVEEMLSRHSREAIESYQQLVEIDRRIRQETNDFLIKNEAMLCPSY